MAPSVTPQHRHEWLETCGAGARVLVLDDGFATGYADVVPFEARKFLQQPTLGIHGCKW